MRAIHRQQNAAVAGGCARCVFVLASLGFKAHFLNVEYLFGYLRSRGKRVCWGCCQHRVDLAGLMNFSLNGCVWRTGYDLLWAGVGALPYPCAFSPLLIVPNPTILCQSPYINQRKEDYLISVMFVIERLKDIARNAENIDGKRGKNLT